MTLPNCLPRRRLLCLLAAGLVLAALPLGGDRPWEAPRAWADDDDDNSGPGGGDDDDDDDRDDDDDDGDDDNDDDDDGRDVDDDRDDDHNSGPGGGGDEDGSDDDRDDGDDRAAEEDRDGSDRRLRNITVLYPDGWTERIVDGRYELLDHQSRLVVRREATTQDFGRMIALR